MPDDYQPPVPPKVSVILVVRNQIAELRRAIAAIEKSTGREQLEILVVDRAGDDETSELNEEFPQVTLLRLPYDFGATKAMNIGTRTAKGDYLLFLSPSVEVQPGTIIALAERLENDSAAVAVCPLLVDDRGQPVPQVLPFPDREFFSSASERPASSNVPDIAPGNDAVDVAYPGHDALLVRRQFVAGMNYFDERLGHHWADADLALRIHRAQKKIRICTAMQATWRPPSATEPNDVAHQADRILGAAVLLGKYNGFFAGLTFRLAAALRALATFKLGLFGALLSGQKLDGSGAS
jgi:GT2 family glycosyltransferase